MAFKIDDARSGFLARIHADLKVVERILDRGLRLRARREEDKGKGQTAHAGTVRRSSEKASREHEAADLRDPSRPQGAPSRFQGRTGGANVIDEKHPRGAPNPIRGEGARHIPLALLVRKIDLARRMSRPSQTTNQNRHAE